MTVLHSQTRTVCVAAELTFFKKLITFILYIFLSYPFRAVDKCIPLPAIFVSRHARLSARGGSFHCQYASFTSLVARPVARGFYTVVLLASHCCVAAAAASNSWRSNRNALVASATRLQWEWARQPNTPLGSPAADTSADYHFVKGATSV